MILSFKQKRWLLFFGDIALILAATWLSPLIRLFHSIEVFAIYTGASAFTLLTYMIMIYIFDLYNMERTRLSRDTGLRLAVAVGMAGFVVVFIFYTLPNWQYGRGIFVIQMMLVFCFLSGWRWILSAIFPAGIGKEDVLIVGAGRSATKLYHLLENAGSPYRVVGFLDDDPAKLGRTVGSEPVIGTTDQLMDIADQKGVRTAILAITHDRPRELIDHALKSRLHGLTIMDMPAVYEEMTGSIPVEHLRYDWLLFADGFYLLSKPYVQRVKRLIDFATSGLLLIISAPIVLLTAIAIKIESRGPVFFRQERVGKDEEVYIVWKFRSMRQDAEQEGAVWADEDDPRVTRVGRLIRFLRIDELPQIVNVFRGDMSFIGPRPERPEFVQSLKARIPYYTIRHSVRPGITGWAQVKYGYGASVEDALKKLEYDVFYIKNMSLLLDTKILLKTIGVVLFGQGAR